MRFWQSSRSSGGPTGSVRLTFVDDGTAVRLLRRTARAKPALRGDDLGHAPLRTRCWVEVRDAADRVVYRRAIADPLPRQVEAFAPDGRITRVPAPDQQGLFSVVVPTGPLAVSYVVVAGADARLRRPGLGGEPRSQDGARELIRVSAEAG